MSIAETYKEFVEWLSPVYVPREAANIARIVMEDAFGIHPPFSAGKEFKEVEKLEAIKVRLLQGEPWQYVLGHADFYGLKLNVDPSVLIPRPETEELVHLLLEDYKPRRNSSLKILDIGTGTGCIALAIKKHWPAARVTGLDKSGAALKIAQANSSKLQLDVEWMLLDVLVENDWELLPEADIIVSNPPYIGRSEAGLMPAQVLNFEPQAALFAPGSDPLIFYRAIAGLTGKKLRKNGRIYAEVNEFRAAAVATLWRKMKGRVEILKDLSGKDRIARYKKSG